MTDTKYTYYRIDYEDCSLEYDYTIVANLEDIEDNIRVVDTDLDDDERKAKVIITGVAMTEKEYEDWLEKHEP